MRRHGRTTGQGRNARWRWLLSLAVLALIPGCRAPEQPDAPPQFPTYSHRAILAMLLLGLLLILPACASPAKMDFSRRSLRTTTTDSYTDEDGIEHRIQTAIEDVETDIRQTSPKDPIEAPSFSHEETPEGGSKSSGSAGAGQGTDQALEQLGILVWIGAGIAILGGATLALRWFFPPLAFLPVGGSLGVMALGIGIAVTPFVMSRLFDSWLFWLALVAGIVVAVLYFGGSLHNSRLFKRLRASPPPATPPTTPAADNPGPA